MKKREKYSLYYFFGILAFFFGMQILFYPDNAGNRELTYNDFLKKVEDGQVERVVIFSDRIIGQFREKQDSVERTLTEAPSAPWRLRIPSIEEQVRKQFIVSRIPEIEDKELINLLLTSGVEIKGRFENNGFRNFFLNWVLPFFF